MDTPESHDNETSTSRPIASSTARISDVHDLRVTLSPTSDHFHEGSRRGGAPFSPLSTSAADALRTAYFPQVTRPRSQSNPDLLSADVSHGSRLADVSETDTLEAFSDLNRSRTQPRARPRRKRKVDRNGSGRVMSTDEEEILPEWTVFGELFEDHQAPFIGKQAGERERKVTALTSLGSEDAGATRSASSVIRHWRSIIANSRPSRIQQDEEHGALNAEGSSPRPVDISSRVKISRGPPMNAGSPRSPKTVQSPEIERYEEPIAPLRRVFDGDEDILDHHRLTADYERSTRAPSKRSKSAKSVSSASSDSSSGSEDSEPAIPPAAGARIATTLQKWKDKIPPLSTLQRNMLKCAIAYFLASLFTFVPFLSSFISDIGSFGKGNNDPVPSAHMIATISVYFNPAKTTGGMFEADVFCFMGVFFASLVTLGSMLSFWIIENRPYLEWLGDTLMFFWLAAAMMTISWCKVYINKASFNTAASMTSIIMFIVVVKEGGFEVLFQVIINVTIGALIANIVCFVLWPQSATVNLQRDMITSLESYATLLDMLSSSFLLDPRSKGRQHLIRAVEAHQAGFTSLKRNLDEARSEWVLDPPDAPRSIRGFRQKSLSVLYGEAVDCLNRLAQHLAGLRSGTKLQRDLTLVYGKRKAKAKLKKDIRQGTVGNGETDAAPQLQDPKEIDEEAVALSAAALVFGSLVDDVGPPMVTLTNACTSTLKSMRKALIQDRQRARTLGFWQNHTGAEDHHDFPGLSANIERALFVFDNTSNQALMRLYRKSAHTETDSVASTSDGHYDDNETMFLVYFFIFTLQEFARELVSLVEVMGQVHEAQENSLAYHGFFGWFRRVFSFKGNKKVYSTGAVNYGSITNGPSSQKGLRPALRRRFSNLVPLEPSHSRAAFPKVRAHAPNTTQTPARSSLSFMGQVKHRLWSSLNKLKDGDMRYSFKVGIGTAILATPAFIDATRPIFVRWRGEWALISYFVVMGQTLGQTNFLSIHRILGTLCGAGVAVAAFVWLSNYPVLLAIFGFLFSLPCFYYIVAKPEYATTGRFVLLSYNLTALFCYNSRSQSISVYDVALHRSIAVTAGVLWALLVSRVWWPSEARRELGVGLSDFLLNVSWLYNRLVRTYSVPPEELAQEARGATGIALPILGSTAALIDDVTGGPNERTGLLSAAMTTGLNTNIRDFMAMELHLQIKLIYLQKLLSQAQHEPRLKGPFPVQLYRSILTSLQMILDLFHSMRCVTTREEWYTNVRRDFVIPVNKERREMVGNVILYFSVLSSAFVLKKPLPPYLPPAERSRQRLVEALKELPIVKERKVQSSRQLLYFAYALMMKGVIAELDSLGKTVQEAFGVIGQNVEEFDSLFLDYSAVDRANMQEFPS